nr:MAG TPA: hypothetical protein [Caudoviricetes sp.]
MRKQLKWRFMKMPPPLRSLKSKNRKILLHLVRK